MAAALVEQLRTDDRLASENAEFVYQALVRDEATSSDTDTDTNLARKILGAARKSADDFARDVAEYRARVVPRVALIQQIADADKLGPALKAARDQLAELNEELDRVSDPIVVKIAKCEEDIMRFHATTDRAPAARKSLIGSSPDWLRDTVAETKRDINLLQDEASRKLAPLAGEATWFHDEWQPCSMDFHGHCPQESQEKFDGFMRRRAAHDEHRASLQPRIAALRERLRRLEELATTSIWPTESDIERIDRELSEQSADVEQVEQLGDATGVEAEQTD